MFGNNVKDPLHKISSNHIIIIDKGEHHEDYICHLFSSLLSWKNSTFNSVLEIIKDNWDTLLEVLASDLINNATEN